MKNPCFWRYAVAGKTWSCRSSSRLQLTNRASQARFELLKKQPSYQSRNDISDLTRFETDPPFSVEQNKDCECCKTPSRRPSAQFFMKNKHKPAGAKIMRFSAKASSSGLGNSWTLNSTEENEENEAPTLSSFPSCSFVKPPFLLSLHHFPG